MTRKKEAISMDVNEAIQTLFDQVARLNDFRRVQNQMIYELCRAFITVNNADPESLIQVIKGCCDTNDLHPHCAVFVESLTKTIENEFIAKSDAEDRPKLRLVTDADAAEDRDPQAD